MKMGQMTPEEMDVLLRSQTLVHVACQRDGKPYLVPLAYAWDGEAIYVHALTGTKIDIMRQHPLVCVQVEAVEHPSSWRSVIGWGAFEELQGEAAARGLRLLVEHLAPPNPNGWADPFVPPVLADRVVIFRVPLTERSGRYAAP